MRQSFTYGSVRGAPGNGRPYRDPSPSKTLHTNKTWQIPADFEPPEGDDLDFANP
jgi:hypothetical protein